MRRGGRGQASPGALGAALGLWLATACSGEEQRPDVVVVVVDTLRADRLPMYGGPAATPFLDALAASGLVFDGTMSTSSWTAPAAASLFTSLHPQQHGVLTGLRVTRSLHESDASRRLNRLPDGVETMAETMRRLGYRTAAVVDNPTVCSAMGFDRGFDHFVQMDYAGAVAVNDAVFALREELRGADPLFLYVHYMDPHFPYHTRAPTFDAERLRGDLWSRVVARLGRTPTTLGDEVAAAFEAVVAGAPDPGDLIAQMREIGLMAYDSELTWLDGHLAELFEHLPIGDDALVVFTADHGEELGDRGLYGHDYQVYEELVRVPLLVRLPAREERTGRVRGAFSLVDVLPTLCAYLGDTGPAPHEGVDLLTGASGERTLFAQRVREGPEQTTQKVAVRSGRWKAVLDFPAGSAELFDLEEDPGETDDRADREPGVLAELRAAWSRHGAGLREYERSFADVPPLTADEIETLERLGYTDGDR